MKCGENTNYCGSLFLSLRVANLSVALGLSSTVAACVLEKAMSATSGTRKRMETVIISFSDPPGRGPYPHGDAF